MKEEILKLELIFLPSIIIWWTKQLVASGPHPAGFMSGESEYKRFLLHESVLADPTALGLDSPQFLTMPGDLLGCL